MPKFGEYLEELSNSNYIVAQENGFSIDLGKHAKERGDTRLGLNKENLISIGKKIANVFNKSNPDGLFGFYSKEDHASGIFRFFKKDNTLKFITLFPNKKIQFFNDIEGMILFAESEDGCVTEGCPFKETIIEIMEI